MTTINLHQTQKEEDSRFTVQGSNKGFIFSLAILGITFVIFAALKLYVPMMEKENVALDNDITNKSSALVDLKNLELVLDMQKRIGEVKSNLKINDAGAITRYEMTDILDHLGNDLSTGIVVSSFKYDTGGKIAVSFDANNFADLAQQIQNFKKSDYFTEIDLTSINRKEGAIASAVSMKIRK